MCTRCKKNPAVVFVSKIDGIDSKEEPVGYCIKCAMELNIGPVKQMMDNMGISPEDVDSVSEQFNSLMGMGEDEDFEGGGAQEMPSLANLFGALGAMPKQNSSSETDEMTSENEEKDEKGGKQKRSRRGAK